MLNVEVWLSASPLWNGTRDTASYVGRSGTAGTIDPVRDDLIGFGEGAHGRLPGHECVPGGDTLRCCRALAGRVQGSGEHAVQRVAAGGGTDGLPWSATFRQVTQEAPARILQTIPFDDLPIRYPRTARRDPRYQGESNSHS